MTRRSTRSSRYFSATGAGALIALAALIGCGDESAGLLKVARFTAGNDHQDVGSDGTGAVTGGSGGGAVAEQPSTNAAGGADAKALFTALEPKLAQNCGPCHVNGTSSAPIWLGEPDPYASIKAYQGIVVSNPKTSLLLTKPQHEGPSMPAALVPDVTAWLTAEAAAVSAAPPAPTGTTTDASALPNGNGGIDLPSPGGRVTFTASFASGILTLKSIQLVAPATTGIRAAGVHIDIVHTTGSATRDETLAATDATAAKGASVALGIGLVVIPNVAATDKLELVFDVLAASDGSSTTPTGGCKDVASFQKNAVPAIQANTCLSCHNAGGSGNGALDLSALAGNTPDYTKACGQAKSRIDTNNPAKSDIILAPTGGVAAHPFKNANAQYTTQMTTWINAEK
jgi:hypothetical protein